MKEYIGAFIGVLIVIGICVGMVGGMWYLLFLPISDPQYVTIEGKVTNVEPFLDDKGYIDYLEIEFDNGESYNVKRSSWSKYVDLTANSYLIVELVRYPHSDEPNEYSIITITKAPGEK